MKVLLRRLEAGLRPLSPHTITAIALCWVLALGVADYCTPGSMSFVLFYMLAVVFAGWGAGKWHAWFISWVALITMVTVHWVLHRAVEQPFWIAVWNHSTRLLVFSITGWLTAEMARLTRNLAEQVEQQTAKWKKEAEEHKATSSDLSASLERFEQVINNITEVFWLRDLAESRVVYISPGYEQIWGRKCEELYREPESWLTAVHPADRDIISRRSYSEQPAGGYDVEYRILRPDGAMRWVRDRAFPVRNAQGEVYRIAGIAEDITEQKQTGQTLQMQAAILENMAEGVVVTDAQGGIVQMNPAAERIWGYGRNEVLGKPASMLSALPEPEAQAVMGGVLEALEATGTWLGTFHNKRKDGAIISCEAVISRVEIQGRVLMVAVEQDVTERLAVQEQLKLQARVLESMAEAVVMIDEEGTIVLTNPAADAALGYSRGELLRRPLRAVSGYESEQYRSELEKSIAQVKLCGSAAGDYTARRKDGTVIEVETRSSSVVIGGQLFVVVVGQDVTHRKQAEQALRQSEESLRVFLDSMPVPAVLLDREGVILVGNLALARRLGRPQGDLKGKYAFGLIPPEIAGVRKASFDQVVLTREPVRHEDEREGRHFINFASPVLDAAGNVNRVAVVALDITERTQAERALARNEELYRTLFELSPDGILLEDTDGEILDVNHALCRSFGYSRESLLGQNVRCFVPPENQHQLELHLAALKAGRALQHEVWNVRNNGERCLMWLNEKPLALPDGRQGILVVARDVTGTKRAELAKEVFLSLGSRLSAASSPVEAARAIYAGADLLWKWDAASLDLYAQGSDRVEPVLNCDLLDGERREVPPVRPGAAPTARMRRILEQGAELIPEGHRTPRDEFAMFGDVSRPSACMMYVPLRREGQPVGILSIHSYTPGAYTPEDLRTLQALADYCGGALDRLRAEAARRQSEELNRAILATAMEGFLALDFAADPQGAITDVNDTYCRMTGYSREELLRMRITDLEAQESPEEVERHKEQILNGPGDRFETRHRRKDGQEVYVEISACRLAGTDHRIFDFVRDITERKRAELTREAFLSLGTKLSAARTPAEAARAIYASADLLWKWDCATLDVYSPETDRMQAVLNYDILLGQRHELPSGDPSRPVTSRMRRIMRQGPELILREPPARATGDSLMVGDVTRPSASLMCVPIRQDGKAVGVLSVQSYTYKAYTDEDLQTLQALADHCGGAFERIRAEAALRESEEQLRAFYDSPGGLRGIVELRGDDTFIVSANAPLAQAYGRTIEGMRHARGSELGVPRPVLGLWVSKLRESLKNGAPVTFEHSIDYRMPWGWQLVTVCPLHTTPGASPRFAFLGTNITERKRAETALRESEERYRSLVNNVNVGVFRNTPEAGGRILQANPALARIAGYDSVEEILKVRVADLYRDPREREAFLTDLLREGTVRNYEVRLQKKDGTSIHGSISATVHRGPDGEVEWIDGVTEDITERKKAEQSLAEALEFNRQIVSASTVGIGVYKASGQCVMANNALVEISGGTAEQLLQQDFRRLKSWHADGLLAKAEVALQTRQPQELECKSRTSFGRELTVSARFSSFVNQGELHLLMMLTDQTAATRARDALRVSEERYRTLAESSPDAIFILDRDIKVEYVNSTASALWGRAPDELIGLRQPELFPPETAQRHEEVVSGVFATGKSVCRDELLTFPAGDQWIETRLAPLYDAQGSVASVMGVCRDITDRKSAERRLTEALDLNQKMLAAATMGISAYKASGECIFANEALARTVGGSLDQVLQGNFRQAKAWRESGLLVMADEALAQGQVSRELFCETRFGKSVWLDCHMASFISNGQPHLLLMALDISERKRAGAALRQAERLQKALLDNIPDPAWLKDAKGRFLACNPALARFYGQPLEAIIGRTVSECVPGEADRMTREDEAVMHTRHSLVGEAAVKDSQGGVRWLESIKSPLCNERDEIIGTVGIARDVTERKQAEALLQAQRDLGVSLSLTSDLATALKHLLDVTMQIGAVDSGGVYLLNAATGGMDAVVHCGLSAAFVKAVSHWAGDSPQMRLIQRGKPFFGAYRDLAVPKDKSRLSEGLQGVAFIPLSQDGRAIGALALSSHVTQEIPPQTQLVIEALATQAAGAIARIRAEAERHRLERQLLEITDREQARIGQDIHDGLCQHLVSLAFDANSLARELSSKRRAQAPIALRMAELADQAITETRQLARGLFPVRLESEGLPSALEELAKTTRERFKIRCRFRSQGTATVPSSTIATHLYRIAQEAVANAVKHSQAQRISIGLTAGDDQLWLKVEDDGKGMRPEKSKGADGMGLHIMDYRARSIGGTLRVAARRRGGTQVFCCVPRPLM
jgi:PAS domain S-box-containing protein